MQCEILSQKFERKEGMGGGRTAEMKTGQGKGGWVSELCFPYVKYFDVLFL